ncbi:metallophosphoesterase [Cohnella sp.]|uniref:metallophosphoesterase family protein n=1 Tax=Cohnella sp. TaxID=1883426 RepID=UPI003564BA67
MDAEQPLLEFQVLTDTHLTGDSAHPYNRNFAGALADIAANAPNSRAIIHVGDVTDHGTAEEYDELKRILLESAASGTLPQMRFATGNHDMALGKGAWETLIGLFLSSTGMPAAYSDCWIDGYPFIFLGTEQALELNCALSKRQLRWLDRKLTERASPSRPSFLFLHQPLKNTVAGSYDDQAWHGVEEDEELREVLSRHPGVILFTGHTHWELESRNCAYDGCGRLPAMFNAASVAYLWTDEQEHKDGSQGYYVEVYKERVRIKGRDFRSKRWIPQAQFELGLPLGSKEGTVWRKSF